MTHNSAIRNDYNCPGEPLLRVIAGKWKPQIFKVAIGGPFRFNHLLKEFPQANKQSLSVALRDMEEAGILLKTTIKEKPLHIEYELSDKGREVLSVYKYLSDIESSRP